MEFALPGNPDIFLLPALLLCVAAAAAEAPRSTFHVCAFYTDEVEEAHLSFVREANRWFAETGRQDGFSYETTADWTRLEPLPNELYDLPNLRVTGAEVTAAVRRATDLPVGVDLPSHVSGWRRSTAAG